jgi:TetR/AcrR family transcriptional regulator, fatty acid metabolism regulator protein
VSDEALAVRMPRDGERRDAILQAAIRVFAQKGYHGCRIADVAREAGVGYGLRYHYFENKEDLLSSVFDESFGHFVRLLEAIAATEGPAAQKVEEIVSAALDAYQSDPESIRVLVMEVLRSPVFREAEQRGAFQQAIRLIASVLRKGVERGELRPIDPFVAATALFGAIEMALTTLVMDTPGSDKRHLDPARRGIVDIFLKGVAAG